MPGALGPNKRRNHPSRGDPRLWGGRGLARSRSQGKGGAAHGRASAGQPGQPAVS